MLQYEYFADAYSWTTDQTDSERLSFLHWAPIIREAKAEVARMRQQEAERAANAKQGRR